MAVGKAKRNILKSVPTVGSSIMVNKAYYSDKIAEARYINLYFFALSNSENYL
jgi:hypothetical protein